MSDPVASIMRDLDRLERRYERTSIGEVPRPEYGCRVTNSANQTIATGTTTLLTFDTDVDDVPGLHSTSVNTGRITFPVGGAWLIGYNVSWASNAAGYRQAACYINGTTLILAEVLQPIAAAGNTIHAGSTRYVVAANDYAELYVVQTSGGNLAVVNATAYSPIFWAVKLP